MRTIYIKLFALPILFTSFSLLGQTTYTLSFIANEGGAVYGEKNQIIIEDSSSTEVIGDPDYDQYFVNWTLENDSVYSSSRAFIIDSVKQDLTLYANFSPIVEIDMVLYDTMKMPEPFTMDDPAYLTIDIGSYIDLGGGINIAGGEGNFSYVWSDSLGITLATNLSHQESPENNAFYIINISDANNCNVVDTVFVLVNTTGSNDFESIGIKVWPNPSSLFNIQMSQDISGPVELCLIDMNGRVAISKNFQVSGNETLSFEANVPEGFYILRIINQSISRDIDIIVHK